MAKKEEVKGSKFSELMKKVNKDVGEEAFTKGMPVYDYDKIPFTSPKMNYITYGGLPVGRIAEFFGEEGGGKTTTALDNSRTDIPHKYLCCNNFQKIDDLQGNWTKY